MSDVNPYASAWESDRLREENVRLRQAVDGWRKKFHIADEETDRLRRNYGELYEKRQRDLAELEARVIRLRDELLGLKTEVDIRVRQALEGTSDE